MSAARVRRGQLVTPFGVGAMSVLVNGTSVVTAGLDHWYPSNSENSSFELSEYVEHDWRLEDRLNVSSFRLPPDFRSPTGFGNHYNLGLKVPVLRFPCWSSCPNCKRLEKIPSTMRQIPTCSDKKHGNEKAPWKLVQVPFVTICRDGHLDDFPFSEWVHFSTDPKCQGTLRLRASASGGLDSQTVSCDACGAKRSLRGITESRAIDGEESSTLTESLTKGSDRFLCSGARPWLGDHYMECGLPLHGALRGSGKVYFPKVESSIYVPISEGAISEETHAILKHPKVETVLEMIHMMGGPAKSEKSIRQFLENVLPAEMTLPKDDDELLAAYNERFGISLNETIDTPPARSIQQIEHEHWRHPEFEAIRETPKDSRLSASDPGVPEVLTPYLQRVRSVDVLRETRVLYGFTRVQDESLEVARGKTLLRRKANQSKQDWLPAYVARGEGIYLELESESLRAWEENAEVRARVARMQERIVNSDRSAAAQERQLTPRFILLHTLAHVLINELVFTCGYSSASLRERVYASNVEDDDMAGILIYTAAGDSEGTMGGLVRMARPENLGGVVQAATTGAKWCSADPVCMDMGERGQGINSCNGAACHGCSLIPETSCEEFNRFLDRGLLIGTFANPDMGYFSRL